MDRRQLLHELSRIHTMFTAQYSEFMSRVGLGNGVDLIWSREPLSGTGLWFEYHDGQRVFYSEAHPNSLKLIAFGSFLETWSLNELMPRLKLLTILKI